MISKVEDRFIRYAKIDTKSDPESETCPSTKKQLHLAKELVKELNGFGLQNISLDKNGYVMATLPANTDREIPVIGFIAHMDTAPDISGKGVEPKLVENYDGKDIVLNAKKNIILSPKDFPELTNYIGQDLLTTDGTTLLGADDKAGIAEIMSAIEYLVENPEIPHGTIKIGFTPDEEIGRGADHFDVEKFGANFAYTMDGGEIGELEYENFNASMAKITIQGRNVHPGTAKNQMINSLMIGMELNALLPVNERPEYTENYEGFFMLMSFKGTVEETSMMYIIRDHDMDKFKNKNEIIQKAVEYMNTKYGADTIKMDLKDQYYNMKEKVEPVKHIVDRVEKAMIEVGVEPKIKAIRGGTDGSRLSYMGLPCPNIFAGGHNFHGRYEYIPIQSMEKAVKVLLKLIENYAKG
ncbi:MAG: peptidase T [Bacteroidetes bacterium 4572_117]|nr:MAG: peptidase T [Bacteroidetes bacterium 4572_117]